MPPSQSPARLDSAEERRTRILNAAEACFVRHGFHRATMHDVAAICRDFEREIAGRLTSLYRLAQDRADPPKAGADPEALARLAMVMADGIMVRRALSPDFATGPVIDAMLTLVGAALDGRFDPTTTPESDR